MKVQACWRGLLLVLPLLLPALAVAHDGPPFPIIVDQNVGPCQISVWADPDIGTGTFFIIVNAAAGTTIPPDLSVQVGVQPASGRLAEVTYVAERESLSGQTQFKALVQFDAREMWRIRIHLQSGQGSGETLATVEATPPGYGRWDLLVYLLPFLAVGCLWIVVFVRKRSRRLRHEG